MNAAEKPTVKIVNMQRAGDALNIRFGMTALPMIDRWAEQYAGRLQDQHLSALVAQVANWEPVYTLAKAKAQVDGVRALQLKAQAKIASVNAELSQIRADLEMPGVEKLAREREIQARLTDAMQTEKNLESQAAMLEGRIPQYKQAADQLYSSIANQANQLAAQDLRTIADKEVAAWAEKLPAGALFLIEHCGPGAVARMVSQLENMNRPANPNQMARAIPQQQQPAQDQGGHLRGYTIDSGFNPAGEVVHSVHIPADRLADLGHVMANLKAPGVLLSVVPADGGWMVLATERTQPAPGELLGPFDLWPKAQDHFQLTPEEKQAAGYQSEPIAKLFRQPGEAAPQYQGIGIESSPGHAVNNYETVRQGNPQELLSRPVNTITPVAFPPFQPNWPPPEDPQQGFGPQPGSIDQNDPFDPYTVAQQAQAQADRMRAAGYQPPQIMSSAATDAPATVQNDPTNGGFNRPPGSPLILPQDVDMALNALQSPGGLFGGPAVELGPDDFPV